MPNYLSPGVYVEEVSSGNKPIVGAGTSTGAFVGIAERGEIGKAILITSWSQFVREFGGFIPNGYLAYAVYGFFAEGGTSCYIVRTCCYSDITKSTTKMAKPAAVSLIDNETNEDKVGKSMQVIAANEGTWGNNISVRVEPAGEIYNGFKLTVIYQSPLMVEAEILEVYDNLVAESVDDLDKLEEYINGVSKFIRIEKDSWKDGSVNVKGSKKPPKTTSGSGDDLKGYYLEKLSGGDDGLSYKDGSNKVINIGSVDFAGDSKAQNGLYAFDLVDTVNILAVPDMAGDRSFILKALEYCKNRKDCFFVADASKGLGATEVKDFKKATGAYNGQNAFNSSYGALYYPWVWVNDSLTRSKKLVPPSGVVAGTYAYTDATRGVHKAPAGVFDGYLDSVIGIEKIVTKGEQEELNPIGVNVIRSFPDGICIWGARTLSADAEWNYINVRRLFLFLEKSIDRGTQWVVFEPNEPGLWGKVNRNLTAFLTRVWRDGALFGSTPDEAFFIKVDEENNPPEVRDAGQLIIEVGVAPVKPAEFVIIRISQKTLSK